MCGMLCSECVCGGSRWRGGACAATCGGDERAVRQVKETSTRSENCRKVRGVPVCETLWLNTLQRPVILCGRLWHTTHHVVLESRREAALSVPDRGDAVHTAERVSQATARNPRQTLPASYSTPFSYRSSSSSSSSSSSTSSDSTASSPSGCCS